MSKWIACNGSRRRGSERQLFDQPTKQLERTWQVINKMQLLSKDVVNQHAQQAALRIMFTEIIYQ